MSLQIGDVCVVVMTCQERRYLIGSECMITGYGDFHHDDLKYLTNVPDGHGGYLYWGDLNFKKKPPDDQKKRETDKPELGSWDVCPFGTDQKPLWRPRKVPA
jgi:hypothetical protein